MEKTEKQLVQHIDGLNQFVYNLNLLPIVLDYTPKSDDSDWAELIQEVQESVTSEFPRQEFYSADSVELYRTSANFKFDESKREIKKILEKAYKLEMGFNATSNVSSRTLVCQDQIAIPL